MQHVAEDSTSVHTKLLSQLMRKWKTKKLIKSQWLPGKQIKLYYEDYISNTYFSVHNFFHLIEKWKVKTPNFLGFWPSYCPQESKHDLEDYCSSNKSVNGSSVGIAISYNFTTQVPIPQGLFTINIFMLPINNSELQFHLQTRYLQVTVQFSFSSACKLVSFPVPQSLLGAHSWTNWTLLPYSLFRAGNCAGPHVQRSYYLTHCFPRFFNKINYYSYQWHVQTSKKGHCFASETWKKRSTLEYTSLGHTDPPY